MSGHIRELAERCPVDLARRRLDRVLGSLPEPTRQAGVQSVDKRLFYGRMLDTFDHLDLWTQGMATLRGWEQVGATDAEIRSWLGQRWGHGGGSSGPGIIDEHHHGGRDPRFGVGGRDWRPERAHAHLRGARLIEAVRLLLCIREPGQRPIQQVVQRMVQGSLLEMCT